MKKNVIQEQADDFMQHVIRKCDDHRYFIEQCSMATLNYKERIHAITFLERLFDLVKISQGRHLQHCSLVHEDECRFARFYHVILFYIKNELDYQERDLPFTYFKKNERRLIDRDIEDILDLLPLKQTSRNNYLKFKLELSEMKSYYFLDKKNWKQLFLGKVMALKNAGVITPGQSVTLLERIEERFLSPG